MTDEELYARSDDGGTSEDERLALSPADGYFAGSSSTQHGAGESQPDQQLAGRGPMSANVPVVPAVMVEDPSLRQDAVAEAKAREAAEERSSTDREAQPVSGTEPSHRVDSPDNSPESQLSSDAVASSPTPLVTSTDYNIPQSPPTVDHSRQAQSPTVQSPIHQQPSHRHNVTNFYSDAPPAYSPRPSRSYGAVTTRPLANLPPSQEIGNSDERQPLLSPTAQSIPSPFTEPGVPILPRRRLNWTDSKKGFRRRAILILAILLALIAVVVVTFAIVAISKQKKHHFEDEPVKSPEPPDGELQWRPLPICQDTGIKDRITLGQSYHFGAHRNLTILQKADDKAVPGGRTVRTFGELILRPATTTSTPAGYYSIESISNSNYLGFVSDTSEAGTRKILSNREIEWQGELDPCIQLRISLFVPLGASLKALDVQATDLNIKFEKGLVMSVAGDAQFLTISGDITTPERLGNQSAAPYRLESPELFVQSVHGQVSGWFPIYDELTFAVRYGNLRATVGHQAPKPNQSRPSKLNVLSNSGNVTIRETAHSQSKNAPPRDHRVDIDTNSGNVYAETLYSSSAQIKSLSGNLNLSLSPGLQSDCSRWGYPFCTIQTEAGTGNTHLVINQASEQHGNMSALRSVHTSSYGDIVAKYPGSWEGNIIALTMTGDMDYRGKGLVMKLWDAITKRMKGRKGNGDSVMTVNTRSGNQSVVIGDGEEDG